VLPQILQNHLQTNPVLPSTKRFSGSRDKWSSLAKHCINQFAEGYRLDGLGMIDVELREVMKEVAFDEPFLIGRVQDLLEEVVPWTVDIAIQTRLADRRVLPWLDGSTLFSKPVTGLSLS